jgi:hypothetical protein
VLTRLTGRRWEGYDFAAEVKVSSPDGTPVLLIDALLRAHDPMHEDVLIEWLDQVEPRSRVVRTWRIK